MAGFLLASHTETLIPLVLELTVASSFQTSDNIWSLLPEKGLRCSPPNRFEWAQVSIDIIMCLYLC